MDTYDIIKHPAAVLRELAQNIDTITDDIRAQGQKMVNTMYEADGIGLAANQVGLLNRIIVIDPHRRKDVATKPIVMVNPEIIWASEELWTCQEGCLSIPEMFADVERPRKVRARYIDLKGEVQDMEAEDLASSCIQHEIDHLDGKLFIDYLSRLKRANLLKKYEKLQRNASEVL